MNLESPVRAAGQDRRLGSRGSNRVRWLKPCLRLSVLAFSLTAYLCVAADEENDSGGGDDSVRSRASPISPRLSAAIRAKLPDYEPAPPTPEKEAMDMTDVVVLEPVVVTKGRAPSVEEWDLLSEEGRKAYLKERYKGATIPGAAQTEIVHNYAMLMHREDVRKQRLSELDDAADTYRVTGYPDDWKDLKKEILKARMRPKDIRAESMDRSYNNDRR